MFQRASGILLHPSSLPSRFGIGDLGPEAHRFLDFMADTGQRYWQMLPLGPTGFGDSPYQCLSAFAGNHLLISPEALIADGLLVESDLSQSGGFPESAVDYGRVLEFKEGLLDRAFKRFAAGPGNLRSEFSDFCSSNQDWLEEYALYRALKHHFNSAPWIEWDEAYRFRDQEALNNARVEHSESILRQKFVQFLFSRQWDAIKERARALGVSLIGDVPIFAAFDSADVWCDTSEFKLTEELTPRVVAGVPPDFFSKTGQLWGNPIYDWDRMRGTGFRWWVRRIARLRSMFDVLRIDHFRGFAATYEIPGGAQTAENGEWVGVPGRDLFLTLKWVFGELPLIAEDLGFVTGDVSELRDEFGIPGMRVLQFAFGGDSKNQDLPHNYERNCVVYTGTHDNDTVLGWASKRRPKNVEGADPTTERELDFCLRYLDSDGTELNWDFIRAALGSVAALVVTPMQDVLSCGSEARMNLPSTSEGNWKWRFTGDQVTVEVRNRLRELTALFGR